MTNAVRPGYYEIKSEEYGCIGDKACGGRYWRPEHRAAATRKAPPKEVFQGEDSCFVEDWCC